MTFLICTSALSTDVREQCLISSYVAVTHTHLNVGFVRYMYTGIFSGIQYYVFLCWEVTLFMPLMGMEYI